MTPADRTPALRLPEFIALFALMTSLTALSIDAMLPALPDMGRSLGASDTTVMQLVISMLIFGMVFGELIFGPLSDAVGRKKAIYAGLAVYSVGTLLAMTATSIEQLLLGRIIQGVGVSGPKIASRALIRDQYEGEAMARIMSFVMMIFILVPMLAPAYGQAVMLLAGWRAIFVSFLILAVVVALWFGLRQPETLPPERRIPLSVHTLAVASWRIVRHAKVMAYTVTAGLIFGAQVVYYSMAQAIFQDIYGTGERFPLYFALLALGTGLASLTNGKLVMRIGMHRLAIAALAGLLGFSTVLMAVAFASGGVPSFAVFMGLCFVMFFCVGILFGNINAMAMQSLGRIAGLGASLIASISSLVAVAESVIVGRFYDGTIIPLVAAFAVSAAAALVLVALARRSRAGPV